jgi:hypothetical protein
MNLFNKRNTNTPRIPRQVDVRILTGLSNAGDPEKREAGRYGVMYYVFLIGIITALIASLVYWQLLRKKRSEWELNHPMALFKELSFVHQLSEQEKLLMQKLSQRKALPSPLQLFVEPRFLLEAWEDDSFVSSQPLVRRLLSKLFDITTEGGELSAVAGMNSETKIFSQSM